MEEAGDKLKQMERIRSDIKQFYENLEGVPVNEGNARTIDLARRYASDTEFFLAKGDLITAFGCINYAHGLLDAFRKWSGEK